MNNRNAIKLGFILLAIQLVLLCLTYSCINSFDRIAEKTGTLTIIKTLGR